MDAHAYIIAGPNGAGKTTFAREFLPSYAECREFLNADMLAAGLSPFDPDAAAIAAGRLLLGRMKELTEHGKTFGFETTLAGKTYEKILREMKVKGYRLTLFYLWVPSVETAIARVRHRVGEGGHNIPEDVIRRRYNVAPSNLIEVYLPLFDDWLLFDSSTLRPREIARCDEGKIAVFDSDAYRRIRDAIKGHEL